MCLKEIRYNSDKLLAKIQMLEIRIVYFANRCVTSGYGICAWGRTAKAYFGNLKILQKKCANILFKKEIRYNSDELFAKLKY